MAFEEFGPGSAHHEQRDGCGAVGEVFEEREHRVVGPVEVLEHDDGRMLIRDVLEESSPGGEQLLAIGGGCRLDPEQRQEPLAEPGPLGSFGQNHLELRGRDLEGIRLEDPSMGLEDLTEGPERDPIAIWQAAALTPGHEVRPAVEVGAQLGDDPALAQARLADDRDQLW